MNGARQALITQKEHIHAGAWPALSTMAGFEAVADAQIEGLMKAHALTAQVFVITASNYVDDSCLNWMKENLGEQDLVKAGGGWSSVPTWPVPIRVQRKSSFRPRLICRSLVRSRSGLMPRATISDQRFSSSTSILDHYGRMKRKAHLWTQKPLNEVPGTVKRRTTSMLRTAKLHRATVNTDPAGGISLGLFLCSVT